jgi:DNA (cytosine-5)-methyltransferase 1
MNELALFAGAGGGILGGLLHGWRTVAAVEIEDYPRRVLLQRQADGILPRFPIWDDVRTFDGRPWRGLVDVITAGFPCQPFSHEGKRKQASDSRNMWPETARIISEVCPKHILLENVRGIRKYLPVVIRDLRRIGYTVERPAIISAGSAGALHIRERVWIYSHANGARRFWERNAQPTPARAWLQTWPEFEGLVSGILQSCVPASRGDGIHDGISNRVDRLKAIGNGQVPAVVRLAWEILTEA